MSLIKRIIELLESKGLRRADLARCLGKSTGHISMWEKRNSNPPAELLPQIADFLGVSINCLYGIEDTVANNDFTYALYQEDELAHDLSEDDIQELKQYADFIRSRNKRRIEVK